MCSWYASANSEQKGLPHSILTRQLKSPTKFSCRQGPNFSCDFKQIPRPTFCPRMLLAKVLSSQQNHITLNPSTVSTPPLLVNMHVLQSLGTVSGCPPRTESAKVNHIRHGQCKNIRISLSARPSLFSSVNHSPPSLSPPSSASIVDTFVLSLVIPN